MGCDTPLRTQEKRTSQEGRIQDVNLQTSSVSVNHFREIILEIDGRSRVRNEKGGSLFAVQALSRLRAVGFVPNSG